MEVIEEAARLPAAGESIYDASGERQAVACVNFADPWVGYMEGYLRAGHKLVEHVVHTNRDQDFLVYPVVFAYRHHLELKLKYLIRTARQVVGEPGTFQRVHRLEPLWRVCRPLLGRVFADADAELGAAEALILELDDLDPTGMVFRYPEDQDGDPTLSPQLRHLDLLTLAQRMEALANLLGGAKTGLDVALENTLEAMYIRQEMEADLEAEISGWCPDAE
ncbi:MAG: hypothetical protein WBF71_15405 [Microthrixaceae bacterium]